MLRRANMNLYLHVKWLFLECFQTAVLQQAEYSVILLTKVCNSLLVLALVLDIVRTVSRLRSRVNLQVHLKYICFRYFISYNVKSFS